MLRTGIIEIRNLAMDAVSCKYQSKFDRCTQIRVINAPKLEDDVNMQNFWLKLIFVFVGLIFLAAAASINAQSPAPRVLTLPELIAMAVANSPQIAQIKSETAAVRGDLDQVTAAYYPQFESTLITGPVSDAVEPRVQGDHIIDPSPGFGDFELGIFGRLEFILTQPIYTFGKLEYRKAAAQCGLRGQKHQIRLQRSEIVLMVKELYYALVLARQGLGAADEAEKYYDDAYTRIESLLKMESDNADQSDLYKIEAYRADAERFRAEANKGVQVSYFALKQLIGLPAGENFDLPAKALPQEGPKMKNQADYIQSALSQRSELKGLQEGIKVRQFLVEAACSDRWPTFFMALKGSFAGAPGRDNFDSAYFGDEFNHAYAGVIVGMQWEFDFGIKKARVAKARARHRKMVHTLDYATMSIPIQVNKAYQDVIHWETAVKTSDKAAGAARKWVITAFANFDMGIGTAKNISDAIDRYGHNRGNYIEALYRYNIALAQLEFVVGATISQ